MPRIAHVLRKYDAGEAGGTETHVAEVTRRLLAEGFRSEVHAPFRPARPDSAIGPEVPVVRYRAFCPFLGSARRRQALWANAGNIVSLDGPLRLARDRGIALAHLHTAGRIGGGVRSAMRLTGRPYLVSVHGPLFSGAAFLREDTRRRQAGLLDLGQPLGLLLGARAVLRDAARVVSFNDAEHGELSARFGKKAVRMDHGVDAARFAGGDAGRARKRWPQLGDGPVVVQLGRLCEQKDQLLALRAFALVSAPQAVLAFAGAETDSGYRAALEEAARELGLFGRVHFLGQLAPGEVPDLLARSTLVLAPSRHEAFGLCVLEAWAASRPVLFARVGGFADLAAGAPGAALDHRDPLGWAAALAAHLRDPARLQAAADRCARLVRSRYSWDRAARELAALYGEILAEAAR